MEINEAFSCTEVQLFVQLFVQLIRNHLSILHMTMTSFVAVVSLRTGKIIKNGLCVF